MPKISNEQGCYPFHMDHLPEYFYQKAIKELNEIPETREAELNKLNDLLSAHELTSDIEFEEDFLHQFLRHRKYDSSKAFQSVQKYLTFRRSHSSLFQSVPDKSFKGNPSTQFASILPYRCPEGCVIVLSELRKWNPDDFPEEYLKTEYMALFLQSLRCPMTQISGFKIIHDFKDTMKLMRYFTPHNIILTYKAAFRCVPARYKEIHFINKSAVAAVAWAIFKNFLSEKMRKRIFIHSSPEDLLNYFPKSILPTQYGGSLESYHDAKLTRKLNKDHGNFPEGGQPNYY